MVKHIVMLRMKDVFSSEEKKEKALLLKQELDLLPSKIDEIVFYEVGLNVVDSPSAYDLVLISHFETFEDLDAYRVHPDHKKVVALIKELAKESAVVDYKI